MKKTIKLHVRQDEVSGELGFCVANMPNIPDAPTVDIDGYQIAHDIVEHVNGTHNIGTIEDELEALGGILVTRVQYADVRRDGMGSAIAPHEHLASDVYMQYDYFVRTGRARLKRKIAYATDYDESIDEIIESGRRHIRDNMDAEDIDRDHLERYLADCKHYLRSGTRKLERRFRRYDHVEAGNAANSLFYTIQECVNQATNWIEWEGQEFKLVIKDLYTAHVEEIYPDDDYY